MIRFLTSNAEKVQYGVSLQVYSINCYIQTDVYIKYLATCILLISEIMAQVLLSEKGGFQLLTVMV